MISSKTGTFLYSPIINKRGRCTFPQSTLRSYPGNQTNFKTNILTSNKKLTHQTQAISTLSDLKIAPKTKEEVIVYIRITVENSSVSRASIKLVDDDTGYITDDIDLESIPRCQTGERSAFSYSGKVKIYQRIKNIGAVFVELNEPNERFFLKSLELRNPVTGIQTSFLCQSWVDYDHGPRLFFDDAFLPHKCPKGLLKHRKQELVEIKGNGQGERGGVDRIYDYDVYNDLGKEFSGKKRNEELRRSTLGGKKLPYPRRYRTGRPLNPDGVSESNKSEAYVPLDSSFRSEKLTEFSSTQLLNGIKTVIATVKSIFLGNPVPKFEEIKDLDASYVTQDDDIDEKNKNFFTGVIEDIFELFNPLEVIRRFLRFPYPVTYNKLRQKQWMSDEEFGRQTIAGMHPTLLQGMRQIPKSGLGPEYGSPKSALTADSIDPKLLDGMTLQEAIDAKKMFMLDYHDPIMLYIDRINALEDRFGYAPRAYFFLNSKNLMMPVAIELNLPDEKNIYTPDSGFYPWSMAKTYFRCADFNVHEVYSHFTKAHACIEPYIIATYRCLSAGHPLYRLLLPHFKDTLEINMRARSMLINAGGVIDQYFLPGKYSLELGSIVYDALWSFKTEAFPEDLISRNMAVRDEKGEIKLLAEDYPLAVDGLLLWDAIKSWCLDYCNYYYEDPSDIKKDYELQEWWMEIKTKGHPDKPADSWPDLKTIDDLAQILTTIIWIASCHHASINFSQYDFAGYMPNMPSLTRLKFPNIEEIKDDDGFEKTYLSTVASPIATFIIYAIGQVLSDHHEDEIYLGDELKDWFVNPDIKKLYAKFSNKIDKIAEQIEKNNNDEKYPSRSSNNGLPYTYLLPKSKPGITGRGIPNSISI